MMGDLYSLDQGANAFWHMVPEFDSAAEAETFAAGFGKAGTAILRDVFKASAFHQTQLADTSKGGKLIQLEEEGDRRSLLVNLAYTSARTGAAINLAISSLTASGAQWAAVGAAYETGQTEIDALTTQAAVDAYDVSTDPPWP